ncbi:cytochrome c biogenesis CcdA family protein [Pseudoduganella sp. LjRoot289]|uniref:cytochrome c biogenesis CcdA family protein n=1 Tax=Pseudoduganella sp. LjRoot289 TaxID=3342314 RepID=UPI003ED172F3
MHNPLEILLALLAGVFTIASPCVLPVLPILLGSAAGTAPRATRSRPLFIVAGFILTFASFAMLLGAVSSVVQAAQEALRNTAIALLALSGLLRVWPRPYEWLAARLQQAPGMGTSGAPGGAEAAGVGEMSKMANWPSESNVAGGSCVAGGSNGGGFVLGMSLGAVWTPCAGPVLASILALVVRAQDLGWSALLVTLYAAGAAIPMLAIMYGGQYATRRVRAVARHAGRLQQGFGVLVIATALAIYFQYDILIYARLATYFPTLKGL